MKRQAGKRQVVNPQTLKGQTLKRQTAKGQTLLSLPYLAYAAIFILAPMILIVYFSIVTGNGEGSLTLLNFARFFDFENPVYMIVLWRSVYLAAISTAICLLIGYPVAYILSTMKPKARNMAAFLFILPMWMNFLLRTYAWMTLLENKGVINSLLNFFGMPSVNIMYTQGAVILGMVYNFLPFMILPIFNMLTRLDPSVIEAGQDLGCNRIKGFFKIIVPLTLPGVISGITMTFVPAVTTFIISKLLGGGQNALIGDLIEQQFKVVNDWGFGSAMSVILMVLILLCMNVLTKSEKEQNDSGRLL